MRRSATIGRWSITFRKAIAKSPVKGATGGSPVWATQSLSALAKGGLIAKVRRGLWELPGHADFSPYAIIPQLLRATKGEKTDVRGYIATLRP